MKNIEMPNVSVILLGLPPEERKSVFQRDVCIPMIIAIFIIFIIAKV